MLSTAILKGVFMALLERADDDGVVLVSIRGLSKELGIGYQSLRTALKTIYANALANATPNAKLTQHLTQINIYNIGDYTTSRRKEQRKANATPNAVSNAIPTQRKPTKFTPPTEHEASEYAQEKGFHFNLVEFVSWNQSKGWKVGGQPMKDWKAAMRTWEIRWKEKHGEQFYYQIGANNSATNQQKDRYSALESATETVLRHPNNLDAYFYDKS